MDASFRARNTSARRRFAEARKQFEAILKDPDMAAQAKAARIGLAGIDLEVGETGNAEAAITRLLEEDGNHPEALNFRAYLDVVRGENLARAEARFREVLKDNPENLGIKWQLGLALARQKSEDKKREGLAVLQEVARDEVVGRNPVFWDHLGDVSREAGRTADARMAWRKALQVFPTTTAPDDRRRSEIEKRLNALDR